MPKKKLLVLHPKEWAYSDYGKQSRFDISHVSIGGTIPKKRNGTPTFDGYADMATTKGIMDLREAVRRIQPDAFLYWMHGNFLPSLLIQLSRLAPKMKFVNWFGNHRFKVPGNVTRYKQTLDMLLINSKDPKQLSMYRKHVPHVFCLYDGFSPLESPLVESEPKYDVFFGGNSYLGGVQKNHKLNFPGGKIRYDLIVGCNKRFKLLVTTGYPKFWPFKTEEEIFHPLYAAKIREAKISLNVNHFPSLKQAYTRRTIRSLFARRCHITLYIPGMEVDFENHKDLVWFHTIDEAFDLIRYYLDHDNKREEIAWAGWNKAINHYTFEHRLNEFSKQLRSIGV